MVSINGLEIESSDELAAILADKHPGDLVTIKTIYDTNVREYEIDLVKFSTLDEFIYLYMPLLGAAICLFVGVWTYNTVPRTPLAIPTALFYASLSLILGSFFNFVTSHDLSSLLFLGVGMTAGSLIQIVILLPRRWNRLSPRMILSFIGYPHNLILVAMGVYQLRNLPANTAYLRTFVILGISLALSFTFSIVSFIRIRMKSISPIIHRYLETFIGAMLLSILPLSVQIVVNLFSHRKPPINPFFILPLIFLPLVYIFTTRRHSLPHTQKRLYQTLVLIFSPLFFGLIYFAIVYLINKVLLAEISPDNPLIIGSLILLVVLVFDPIRDQIKKMLSLENGGSFFDREILALEFMNKLSAVTKKNDASILLRDAIEEIYHPEVVRIFIKGSTTDDYQESALTHIDRQSTPVISSDAPLPSSLAGLDTTLVIRSNSKPIPGLDLDLSEPDPDQTRSYIPIQGHFNLLGWVEMYINEKQDSIRDKDLHLIESLTTQFALVYERLDTFDSMQRQLKEMAILNQIATAINNLSDFDQILLAIYEIIKEVISLDQFSLVLRNEETGVFQRFFSIEKDEVTISTTGPKNLPKSFPEEKAILEKKAVFRQEGDKNCLCVPLEIENRIVGALSLTSGQTGQRFSESNLNLAQAITNLVTGAIIKSRLLQMSQIQTEHLAKLNEVSRQLTSTLAMEPLLKRIVESANEILKTTSGALLVVEEDESLTFKVTDGPVGLQLLGKNMPKDKGVAGQSYRERNPVIKNSFSTEEMYFWSKTPEAYKDISNVLAVPLIMQDEIIGILEVFNKEDNQPFNENDIVALESFASQAVITMYNARLYAKTDQALERRIEELYTMQQIDSELHSSQKLEDALKTALKAGLTYTKVKFGSIMLVDTYYNEIDDIWQKVPGNENLIHKNRFELNNFPWFSEDKKDVYQLVEGDADELSEQLGLAPEFRAHALVTSKLEDELYSLLVLHLNTPDDIEESDIEFLLSLNNHAVIALRNAILYEDLQDAVNAKNEFISFISHELKNPLTAIKGHADVLAKGMVGEINEEQEDFLRTISHNVRRMSTFITDLSDQSQIESKSLRFVFATAEVSEVVDEVLQTYDQPIRAKSIRVENRVDEDLPQVWCDRQRLIQVLANLVSNAVKYTPEGGKIIIAAEHAFNEWDPKGAAEVVHFSVEDNGFGIEYEDQDQIFSKFFRGTNETILKISGTGLGLRISKSLTEMMGGAMWFESTPGEGTTFHFTIPI